MTMRVGRAPQMRDASLLPMGRTPGTAARSAALSELKAELVTAAPPSHHVRFSTDLPGDKERMESLFTRRIDGLRTEAQARSRRGS